MWGCRTIEGLMAASLYEPLSGAEDARLQRHLAQCAECSAEFSTLRSMVEEIPRTEVPFEGDLWPALRGQLEQPATFGSWRWLSSAALAAAAAVVIFAGYGALKPASNTPGTVQVASSAISEQLRASAEFRAAHEYEKALHVLQAGMQERLQLTRNDQDDQVGLLAAEAADIWFEDIRRYEAALGLYDALREQHYEVFTSNSEYSERWNLLTETSREQFQPLYALDAARGSGSFEALEKIVAQRPDQSVGQLALAAMQEQVLAEVEPGSNARVASLEHVRTRCKEPAAIALVNLMLGNAYWKELDDTATARELYEQVADSPQVALATQARKFIGELNAAQ